MKKWSMFLALVACLFSCAGICKSSSQGLYDYECGCGKDKGKKQI